MKTRVPMNDYHAHLQGYQAEPVREYSNGKRHVYYSRPMGKYIIARRRGNQIELEFTAECPCGSDD